MDGIRPRCLCPPRCPDRHINRVCGTDGITYPSFCKLMRTACVIGDSTITKKHDGRCGEPPVSKPTTAPSPTPSPTGTNCFPLRHLYTSLAWNVKEAYIYQSVYKYHFCGIPFQYSYSRTILGLNFAMGFKRDTFYLIKDLSFLSVS